MSTRDVAEVSKLQEIIKLLESLKEAAHQLPEDTDRRGALREIRDFQLRVAALAKGASFDSVESGLSHLRFGSSDVRN